MADITEEQRIEIKAAFDLFDTDGNGSISATELASILKKMGTEASESELKDMIHEIDVDGDGEIQFEEFLLLFSRHKKNQLPEDEELRQAFKVFDADGNGTISKVELKRVMDMLGEKLNDAQIDEMMKEADTNGDGEIDFGEFKKMMASKGL
ncbi:uncharacterized protein ACA1_192080 [Acanthamoeba castellanii str. Neff]|uniref:EF-hand domain-containing protein n=1 Tax=Acanthamoeba castellanii (strain ATCC 30010 / Neff) TaxID=1257118 RepID=L8GPA7_ACACF|nr:uncharacterized protein ACA1_192080 [Acanthamoeba castellanii str. Neff]ELR14478.1 hypothetical protein ACA1_192080 [Acanthamoeba castellanii str. Neff]